MYMTLKHPKNRIQKEKPCIIVFYADRCGLRKMVVPVLEELSYEYNTNLDI
jgi:thiol-disulfide isomerase/thioredoxin